MIALLSASAQETSTSPLHEAQIHELASRILSKADKADCKPQECKILVANFTFGSGLTSQLGVQLADQFAKELASQQNEIQIIDRSTLGAYLQQERIPGALLNNEKAMRWLGKELGGTAVLTGLIEDEASSLRLKIHLLSCDKEKESLEDELPSEPQNVLTGVEAFPQKPPDADASSGSAIPKAGENGVAQPRCIYCPYRHFTQAASDAKFNGTVLLEVVVSPDGRVTSARIVNGAPYGLNQEAINDLRAWKFKPAALKGTPVTARATVQLGFRLN